MSNTSETPEIVELRNKIIALGNAITALDAKDYPFTAKGLMIIRDDFERQLKDLKFDQETNPLPFPEK